MAESSDFLAEQERQGEVAGKAAAEQDYQAGRHVERATSVEALSADAWAAAREALRRSGEPYDGDVKMAEEAFATGFIDAYIVRLGELSSAVP